MKLKIIMVTYDGDKRFEEPWEDIPEDKRRKLGASLCDQFMKTAGYSPVVPA